MSAVRPVGRLLASAASSFRSPRMRTFSSTPMTQLRRRASPQDLIKKSLEPPRELSSRTAPYTEAEIEELHRHFSPEQLSALLAGEHAINRADFEKRMGRRPGDPFALKYLDDLSSIDPLLDFLPEGPALTRVDKSGWIIPRQDLPKLDDPDLKYPVVDQEADFLRKLSQQTGMPIEELKSLRTRLMVSHSVTNQTRMGKIRKVYALAVAGNGDGLLGVGEGKAVESEDAIRQATYMAIRNMEPIPRYEGRTIYGDVVAKEGAVEMKLFTRPPGFGVRCSSHIFEMCRCLGIHDLSARVTRSRNPMNVIKTFLKALKSQKLPETIARGRGKKFVDVRKVYYGGK